jgi:hypothetical protein
MNCPKCGNLVQTQNKFCGFCGERFFRNVVFIEPKNGNNRITFVVVIVFLCFVGLSVLSSVVIVSLNSVRAVARDSKRISDVRSLISYLENYHSENKEYPLSLEQLKSKYPFAPILQPVPVDGNCVEPSDGQYLYKRNNPDDFSIYFCLGGESGGLKAGIHTAKPSGIE